MLSTNIIILYNITSTFNNLVVSLSTVIILKKSTKKSFLLNLMVGKYFSILLFL